MLFDPSFTAFWVCITYWYPLVTVFSNLDRKSTVLFLAICLLLPTIVLWILFMFLYDLSFFKALVTLNRFRPLEEIGVMHHCSDFRNSQLFVYALNLAIVVIRIYKKYF